MDEVLNRLGEQLFVGPMWPASILACLLVFYTVLSLIGLIDLDVDVPDIDLDVDPGLDLDVDVDVPDGDLPQVSGDFLGGIGGLAIRWTNFGRIPIVLWGGVLTVAFWGISAWLWNSYDSSRYEPTWLPSTLLSMRNFVIAMALTKGLTQPMLKFFVPPVPYSKDQLLGCTCEIWSTEATDSFGQAKFRTQASPLLLNVRTDGPTIPKGTEVRIVSFDSEKRIYTVTNLPSETQL